MGRHEGRRRGCGRSMAPAPVGTCQRVSIITLILLLRVFSEQGFFPFLDPRRQLLFGPKEGQPQALRPLPPLVTHRKALPSDGHRTGSMGGRRTAA